MWQTLMETCLVPCKYLPQPHDLPPQPFCRTCPARAASTKFCANSLCWSCTVKNNYTLTLLLTLFQTPFGTSVPHLFTKKFKLIQNANKGI